jgi:hypothetical protein
MKTLALSLGIGACCALVACTQDDDKDGKIDGGPTFVQASVPVASNSESGMCEASTETPSLCDWAWSFDAILVARVVEAGPILDKFMFHANQATPIEVQSCKGPVHAGMFVKVQPMWTLFGEEISVSEITVRAGSGQMEGWAPRPVVQDPGVWYWAKHEGAEDPFAPGSVVALPILYNEGAASWTFGGEPPFTFTSAGAVLLPQVERCGFSSPEVPETTTHDALKSTLAECQAAGPSENSKALHQQRRNMYGSTPEQSHTSTCLGGYE